MSIFKKKSEDKCCNSENFSIKSNMSEDGNEVFVESVKVLGSGCAKCNELENNTISAFRQLGINAKVEHVTDFVEIASYGVMATPALVYNGKVLCFGKVLKTDELVALLKKKCKFSC